MTKGDRVYVNGKINYRGIWTNIQSAGVIEHYGEYSCLVALDELSTAENNLVIVKTEFITEEKSA